MKKNVLLFIVILGVQFFDLNVVSKSIANGFTILSAVVIIFGILIKKKKKYTPFKFKKLIYLFYFGMFINFLMMFFYNGSSLYDSVFVLLNYSGFLLYFYLHRNNYNEKTIISMIVIIALMVSFFMLVQQVIKPIPIFNQLELHPWYLDQRGTARVRIPGMALVVFSYFLYLFKYLKTFKIKYIGINFFFLAILIMQGFRSILLALFICSILLYWYGVEVKNRISLKKIFSISFMGVFALFAVFQIEYLRNIFEEMFLQVEEDQKIGDNNIRVFSFIYYLWVIKNEFWMYFTGNGLKIPYKTPEGLYAVDLGIFGFYALAGFIPTYALLKSFVRGVFLSKKSMGIVYGAFFLYILENSFLMNAEAFRTGIFHIYAIVFYLIELRIVEASKEDMSVNLKIK